MEKLVLRHEKVPAEVSLINYDDAMQIAPAAQLACHCGGRITHGLDEKWLHLLVKFKVTWSEIKTDKLEFIAMLRLVHN